MMIDIPSETSILAKLIPTALSKAQILAFLDLPPKTKDHKTVLVKRLLALIETEEAEKIRLLTTFKSELAVNPTELEMLLQCSQTERRRWLKEGRIPILEYRLFRKWQRELTYPVHDRLVMLSISQKDIQQWREVYDADVHERRQAAARIATKSKRANQQSREAFLASLEKTVTLWEQQGSPELAAVFELAYWTVWASRWAKENQVKSAHASKYAVRYAAQKEVWYERKNEAMHVLSQTPFAQLSFYRSENADKWTLHICDEHWEEKKEGYYTNKWEFYEARKAEIHKCPQCLVKVEKGYYSLYCLTIQATAFPELHFSFHMPYSIGKMMFSALNKLPQVEHSEQDGMFRFGRSLLAQEKIIHREKDVQVNFERALVAVKKLYPIEEMRYDAEPRSYDERDEES